MMSHFKEHKPSLDSHWRSIILFGRNAASYKFALAKSLYELANQETNFVTLEELAIPFSKNICEHIKLSEKQGTSASSQFLGACRQYNNGEITNSKLLGVTTKLGFENVIDAFHTVNQEPIRVQFYIDERKTKKGLTITDNLFKLKEGFQFQNLLGETEARWRLVETAWSLEMNPNLLEVKNDAVTNQLYLDSDTFKRISITSCRNALNGYQKGKCFYTSSEISIDKYSDKLADVDHFFPHSLKPFLPKINLDGIWNLVLASRECNRGEHGKFARIPSLKYLEKLHQRNSYLIESHHPLRETLIKQTGSTNKERIRFLQHVYAEASNYLGQPWEAAFSYEEQF